MLLLHFSDADDAFINSVVFLNFELSSLSLLISHVALLILIPNCAPVCVYLFISMVTACTEASIISSMEFCDIFPLSYPDFQVSFYLFHSETTPSSSSQTQISPYYFFSTSRKGSQLPK